MVSDRFTGAFFICFGLLLYAVIIPWQIETVDYGWLKPRTLPRVLAIILVLSGVALMLRPVGDARPSAARWDRAVLFAAVLFLSLLVMSYIGFVYTAPFMALALMWLAHERRWLWLALGSAGMPALIWLVVAVLLERPLP